MFCNLIIALNTILNYTTNRTISKIIIYYYKIITNILIILFLTSVFFFIKYMNKIKQFYVYYDDL